MNQKKSLSYIPWVITVEVVIIFFNCSSETESSSATEKNMIDIQIHTTHKQMCTETCTNIYKHTQTYTNIHKHIQTYTNVHKDTQTYTNNTQTYTNIHYIQTHKHKYILTIINMYWISNHTDFSKMKFWCVFFNLNVSNI